MSTLMEWANRIAKSGVPGQKISYGPWAGSMRSRSAEQVPRMYGASPLGTETNYHYLPREGWWKRRKGQTQKFDTFGSAVGMLPAKWSSRCRQLDEFTGDSFTDGIPTVCSLLTKETIASGLDDGRFSTLWVRDQVASVNYTLGDEFSSSSYPTPGSTQLYKYVPLWYDSGDGGITRGVDEFQRRLFLNGSRSMAKVGNWRYCPSVLGTPSRFRDTFTAAAALINYARPEATSNGANWAGSDGTPAGNDISHLIDEVTADSSDYARIPDNFNSSLDILLTTITDPGVNTGHTISAMVAKTAQVNPPTDKFTITLRVGTTAIASYDTASSLSSTPTTFSYTLSGAEAATIRTTGVGYADLRIRIDYSSGTSAGNNDFRVYHAAFQVGTSTATASRLIPSGPIPPTHPGYITKGNVVASSLTTPSIPDGDVSAGTWIPLGGPATLYQCLTDSSVNLDNDRISSTPGGNSACEVSMADFGFTPTSLDTVTFGWRAIRSGGTGTLQVDLVDGVTVIATATAAAPASGFTYYSQTLTAAQITTLTAADPSWSNIRLRFTTAGLNGVSGIAVSWAQMNYTPSGSVSGGWKGKDRFPFAIAYRFEDDSVFAFSTPRLPNTNCPDGIGIFTVDSANPGTGYDKITWTLPIPPYGVKSVLMLRGTKIDSTTEDNLAMNLHDLRIVDEVDAGVTSYDDYAADDDAIYLDVDKLLIHEDHIMPPRARWIFGGDSRVCHSYGGLNPAAITLAPVGVTADWDRNLADTSSTAFSNPSSYYQITTAALILVRDTGAAVSTKTFSFAAGALGTTAPAVPTIQHLVDAINDTSTADTDWSGGAGTASQWRAQILPGVNPAAACTYLCPTVRTITSVVTASNTSLTKAAGGLSAIPVGAFVTGTGITDGTYVTAIVSDTALTISANATASGTVTLTFVAGTGDSVTGATHTTYEGYIRVIANSLPGFLYFTKTYLNLFPIEKSAVWMTSASPLSNKSAANCFKGLIANKHTPPSSSGISMGGAGVDNGFVLGFSQKRAVIRNTRDSGTGLDSDYRLLITNDASGVCGPIIQGDHCAFSVAPEGVVASNLEAEVPISGAIWQHPQSDAVTGTGDFSYEMPLLIAAAGSDTDTGMMYGRVMKNALWLNYRTSASTTHPDRRVKFDFSASNRSGLLAMLRDQPVLNDEGQEVIPAGIPWGWSYPLAQSGTCMCEGRRSDGAHMYAWNQANAGSTGDGRIDEIETSDTDNGTAISARMNVPWESLASSDNIQGREVVFEHNSPAASTVAGHFVRSLTGDAYSCTPDVSSSLVVSVYRWILSTAARVHSAACYVGFSQTAGGAGEVRRIELLAAPVKDIRAGTAG